MNIKLSTLGENNQHGVEHVRSSSRMKAILVITPYESYLLQLMEIVLMITLKLLFGTFSYLYRYLILFVALYTYFLYFTFLNFLWYGGI
jgi:hypothetical protein